LHSPGGVDSRGIRGLVRQADTDIKRILRRLNNNERPGDSPAVAGPTGPEASVGIYRGEVVALGPHPAGSSGAFAFGANSVADIWVPSAGLTVFADAAAVMGFLDTGDVVYVSMQPNGIDARVLAGGRQIQRARMADDREGPGNADVNLLNPAGFGLATTADFRYLPSGSTLRANTYIEVSFQGAAQQATPWCFNAVNCDDVET
jgi:hypothetical protein